MPQFNFAGVVVVAIGRKSADGVTLLGTAFGVRDGLIATAAHVVGHSDRDLVAVLPMTVDPFGYQDTTIQQVQTTPVTIVAFDPVKDLAILQLPSLILQNKPELASADNSAPGEFVLALGYPHADVGRLVLTQHSAVVGAKVLLGSSSCKIKHLVLNIHARPGQSGSPVMGKDRVVAVLTGAFRPQGAGGIIVGGIDPATLHQTTHAVSAEYIEAML